MVSTELWMRSVVGQVHSHSYILGDIWVDFLIAAYGKGRLWNVWVSESSGHKILRFYMPPVLNKVIMSFN